MAGLYLVYEPEDICRRHLLASGFAAQRAVEISSYLAQSTDIATEFDAIGAACRANGIGFTPVKLDDFVDWLPQLSTPDCLVWTLTDGTSYFRGSAVPAMCQLRQLPTIGSDSSVFALCQDKFRSGAVLRALGLPCPAAGLARNGTWLVEPPRSEAGWFVKPNRLGAKIGIWTDSYCRDLDAALELSRRVFSLYRDDVVVQPYVPGRNVRASFLGLRPATDMEALGVSIVGSGSDFQTMNDSLALYGDTGTATKAAGRYSEPTLQPLAATQPGADQTVRDIASVLVDRIGLRDVFSIDLRVEADDTVHLIEFEVCPGLPCFDFRAYCRDRLGLNLPEAMAAAAANRLTG